MNRDIESLKHAVLQLEQAVALSDSAVIKATTTRIVELATKVERTSIAPVSDDTGIYFKKINTIPFLYKPMYHSNPYAGNFLENFARERTEQLSQAGAIQPHNRFWTDHQVINGNIFGSVPKELLSDDAIAHLKRAGWLDVDVDILDFGEQFADSRQIYQFCSAHFDKFICINEQSTDANMALKFAV